MWETREEVEGKEGFGDRSGEGGKGGIGGRGRGRKGGIGGRGRKGGMGEEMEGWRGRGKDGGTVGRGGGPGRRKRGKYAANEMYILIDQKIVCLTNKLHRPPLGTSDLKNMCHIDMAERAYS